MMRWPMVLAVWMVAACSSSGGGSGSAPDGGPGTSVDAAVGTDCCAPEVELPGPDVPAALDGMDVQGPIDCPDVETHAPAPDSGVQSDLLDTANEVATADVAAEADSTPACCPIGGEPSCDCFDLGGSPDKPGGCHESCDSAPDGWHMETDEQGCPIWIGENVQDCFVPPVEPSVLLYVADHEAKTVSRIEDLFGFGSKLLWTAPVERPAVLLATHDGGVVVSSQKDTLLGNSPGMHWVLAKLSSAGAPLWSTECCDESAYSAVFRMDEDQDGNVWVADTYNKRFLGLDASGAIASILQLGPDQISAFGYVGPVVAMPDGSTVGFSTSLTPGNVTMWHFHAEGALLDSLEFKGADQGMHLARDPLAPQTDYLVATAGGIYVFHYFTQIDQFPSDAMTDEFGACPDGSIWRVFESEPLILRMDRDGQVLMKLMYEDLLEALQAFNSEHGTAYALSGDYNRLGVAQDGSVYVSTHAEVYRFSMDGALLDIIGGFQYAVDVEVAQ